jgi:hypothetical protein
VEKRVDDFHNKIIEEHRKTRKTKRKETGEEDKDMDFVDVLLSLPGENGKEHMDDVEIKALIQVMIASLKMVTTALIFMVFFFSFQLPSNIVCIHFLLTIWSTVVSGTLGHDSCCYRHFSCNQ